MLYTLLQFNGVQTFLVQKIAARFSKELNTKVTIQRVKIRFLNRLVLEGFLVEDHQKDTLLYAGTAKADVNDWFIFKDKILLDDIQLDNALVNLNRSDSVWNYQFLADYFSSPKKSTGKKSNINLNLKQARFNNIRFNQIDGWVGQNMIASVGKMDLSVDSINLNNSHVYINSLALENTVFSQYDYNGKRPPKTTTNLVSKSLSDTNAFKWNNGGLLISAKIVSLKNASYINDKYTERKPYQNQFDGAHINFYGITGSFKNLLFKDDTLSAKIDITAQERSGLQVKKLSSNFKFTPDIMEFRNLDLQTNKSKLGNYFAMRYKEFNHDMANFLSNVKMDANFEPSTIYSDDIAYFSPQLKTWKRVFDISGKANGSVEDFDTYNFRLKTGPTFLHGNLSMRGLPDINDTYINLQSRQFNTNYNDIVLVLPELKKADNVDFRSLGNISYNGNFSGYLKDFLLTGNIVTSQGNINVKGFRINTGAKPVEYKGYVQTSGFNIGRFTKQPNLGIIALNGNVDGRGTNLDEINTSFKGFINRVDYAGTTYTNITAHNASIEKNVVKGNFDINDPKLKIKGFNGSFVIGGNDMKLNLEANASRVNLKDLGITKENAYLSGLFNLNFSGKNIDDFLGSARIFNATLETKDKKLSFDSLSLHSQLIGNKKLLTIQSNEFDVELAGNFKVQELPVAFQYFLHNYYPSFIARPSKTPSNQDFRFNINTRNADEYIKLIHPKLGGFDYANISGKLTLGTNELVVTANVPHFSYDGKEFTGIKLEGNGNADTLFTNLTAENVKITDSLQFPESRISLTAHNDITKVNLVTTANKTLNNAELNATVKTYPDGVNIIFQPSSFVINDKKWVLEEAGELNLRNNAIDASHIRFNSGKQSIILDTELDDVSEKRNLIVKLQEVVIDDISPFFITNPSLKGKLTGTATITDVFKNATASFKGVADSFRLNDQFVGRLNVSSDVKTSTGQVNFLASSNGENIINIDGSYNYKDSISESPLLVNLNAQKFNLKILQPFLITIFDRIDGMASGTLRLTGNDKRKSLVGKTKLDSADVVINYTKAHYNLQNEELNFGDGYLDFGNITLHDTLHNTGTITGRMYHNFFDELRFENVRMQTPKLVLLNTTKKDNSQFYGYAIGRGDMSLNGALTNLVMNISGEPSITDSSHIVLPTGDSKETGAIDYIDFMQFGHEMEADAKIDKETNIFVNLDLIANPSVTIDVVLNEATKDIISGKGNGKLNIRVGTDAPLTMFGRYDLTGGTYNYNFQSFLDKKFNLNEGSISWNGDPYLANLNIYAKYVAENVNMSALTSSDDYLQKEDLTILTHITGTLKEPKIDFDFQLPASSSLNQNYVVTKKLADLKNDEDQRNKQIASLLLLNTFITEETSVLSYQTGISIASNTIGGIISDWLSGIINNELARATNNTVSTYIDINPSLNLQDVAGQLQANIRAGIQFYLSNRMKMKVGSNIEYNNPYAIAFGKRGLVTPDITIEWILNKDGSIRVVGFNRTSVDITSGNRNRSGVQLTYRKEFDRFSDIFKSKKKVQQQDSLRRAVRYPNP